MVAIQNFEVSLAFLTEQLPKSKKILLNLGKYKRVILLVFFVFCVTLKTCFPLSVWYACFLLKIVKEKQVLEIYSRLIEWPLGQVIKTRGCAIYNFNMGCPLNKLHVSWIFSIEKEMSHNEFSFCIFIFAHDRWFFNKMCVSGDSGTWWNICGYDSCGILCNLAYNPYVLGAGKTLIRGCDVMVMTSRITVGFLTDWKTIFPVVFLIALRCVCVCVVWRVNVLNFSYKSLTKCLMFRDFG